MTTAHVPHGRNNFDFLRFAAASTVVIGHGFWLSGHIGAEPILNFTGFTDAANIAVYVFFVISGFLIRRPSSAVAIPWTSSSSAPCGSFRR